MTRCSCASAFGSSLHPAMMPSTSPCTFFASSLYLAAESLFSWTSWCTASMLLRMFSMPLRSGASVAHFLPLFSSSFAGAAPWSCL